MQKLHPKVAGATIAGAISTILMWLLTLASVDVPPGVAAAFTTLIALIVGYFVPVDDGVADVPPPPGNEGI